MTVLSACIEAAKLMGMGAAAPTAIYGSTSPVAIDFSVVANQAAKSILKAHDWRKLTALFTSAAGDGTTTTFTLPTDYDRMPLKAMVWSSTTNLPLHRVEDLDEWLEMNLQGFTGTVGSWILLGGSLQVLPALATAETAKFYYISNLIVTPSIGDNKAVFDTDTDVFRLDERLLTLGIIWRWRAIKGLDYTEEMRNFEIAMGEEAGREKGSRIIAVGRPRVSGDVQNAYPGVISA
jgi:hypothetical protein